MHGGKDTLDFIVIGAQKSGTTSLFQYLKQHPEISLPKSKEAPYFSHDRAYARGWEAYISSLTAEFPCDDPARRWGTVTTHYMVGGAYQYTRRRATRENYDERTVPARIRERLPDVRLIAILRDPVERALSHHRMEVSGGREARSFDKAVQQLLRPDSLERARRYPQESTGYVVWGEYGRILTGYLDVFEREQLLVVFTHELEHSPQRLLSRIQSFIGVNADFTPQNLGERYLVGQSVPQFSWSQPSSWMGPSSPLTLQAIARSVRRNPAARMLWHLIPDEGQLRIRRPYERASLGAAARWNRRSPPPAARKPARAPSSGTLARLRDHYVQDGERLAALLGEAPSWGIQPSSSANGAPRAGREGDLPRQSDRFDSVSPD